MIPATHRTHRARKGFTLIELVVVIAIIGILAAIAVAQLYGFAQKAKQAEAKELLATIFTAEASYYAEQGSYGTLSNVGFTPSSTPRFYTNIGDTNFTYTGGTSYTGTCSANLDDDPTIDAWQITNTTREPQVVTNDIQS